MKSRLVWTVATAAAVAGIGAVAPRADRDWTPPSKARPGPVDVAYGSFAAGIGWTRASCEGAVLWETGVRRRYLFHVPAPAPRRAPGAASQPSR